MKAVRELLRVGDSINEDNWLKLLVYKDFSVIGRGKAMLIMRALARIDWFTGCLICV